MQENLEILPLLQGVRKILKLFRVWPRKGREVTDKKNILEIVILCLINTIIVFGCVSHLLHTLINKVPYLTADIIEDLVICASGIGIYMGIITFIVFNKEINGTLNELADCRQFGKPPNIDFINKRTDYACIAYFIYASLSVPVYALLGVLKKAECERIGDIHGVKRVCGLMAPTYVPWDISHGYNYYSYLFVQTFTCIFICNLGALILVIVVAIVEIFITKIQHLNMLMSRIYDVENKIEYFKMCVTYHLHIINISKKINFSFGVVLLFHMTFSSIIISLIAFQLILDKTIRPTLHLIAWMVPLFLPCYGSQRLINESSKISLVIYSLPWYEQKSIKVKDLQFIILNSSNILALNASGFGNVSISTFGKIMKTSYSILTLLYQKYG